MDNVVCLLKFGEKEHMESLAQGNLFFSNALKYRKIEEELLIKGQGDKLEGGAFIFPQTITIMDGKSEEWVITGIRGGVPVYFEPANLLPVFCLFACYEKDCTCDLDGNIKFHLSFEIEQTIREHFPKADAVAIITDPEQFISDIKTSLNIECVSSKVNYFHLYGFDSERGKANDIRYMKYLTQDVPPEIVNGIRRDCFLEEYVYRSLLCKDIFFKGEQEFRIIFPKNKINEGKSYPIDLETDIRVINLDDFFDANKR